MRGDQGHHAMEEGEGKCMFFSGNRTYPVSTMFVCYLRRFTASLRKA